MTRTYSGDGYDATTCVCCMCRCGDHRCFQQMTSILPLSMQLELKSKEVGPQKRTEKITGTYEADLYRKSTYRRDFCEKLDIIDEYPLPQKKLETNLTLPTGDFAKESVYRDDFIPWCREDQAMCRATLHVPDNMLERVPEYEWSREGIPDQVYGYYCPPHCVGDAKEEKENCLIDYKEKFNIGPPVPFKRPAPAKPSQPFEKFTNYKLDYKGGPISPRREKRDGPKIEKIPPPMSSETSYRSAFTCPPEDRFSEMPGAGETAKDKRSTLKVGDGPMQQETTAMLDYQDPDVSVHMPVRHQRDVYKPPFYRMETTTTTGTAYQRWKEFPDQVKPQKHLETDYSKQQKDDRHLFTTYQQDFDGLNSALCPCRVAEKYGPTYLTSGYDYTGSEREHDIFRYSKNISGPNNEICPH